MLTSLSILFSCLHPSIFISVLLQLKHCTAHTHLHTQASTTRILTSHTDAYKNSVRNEMELCNCGIKVETVVRATFLQCKGIMLYIIQHNTFVSNSTGSTINVNVFIMYLYTDYHRQLHTIIHFYTHASCYTSHTHYKMAVVGSNFALCICEPLTGKDPYCLVICSVSL